MHCRSRATCGWTCLVKAKWNAFRYAIGMPRGRICQRCVGARTGMAAVPVFIFKVKGNSMKYETTRSVRALRLVPMMALCLVSVATQAQTSAATGASGRMPEGHMQQGASGSEEIKHAMMMGMDNMQKMPVSSNIDKDFAMMMKMHHQQGVEMAKIQLARGKSPAMKAMAKQIIAAQNKEIVQFDQWLAKQK